MTRRRKALVIAAAITLGIFVLPVEAVALFGIAAPWNVVVGVFSGVVTGNIVVAVATS